MEGYNVIKKFDTKRNKVFLTERLGKKYIIKRYASAASMESEFKVLRALAGKAKVPKAIHRLDNEIVMEYIAGDSLLEHYKKDSLLQMPLLAKSFAKFLKDFVKALPGYIINDINYRNYIISNNVCYGLDFEFITQGTLRKTTAEAVAFGLMVEKVPQKNKKTFILAFLKEMDFEIEQIKVEIIRELKKLIRNSGQSANAEEQLSILF